jgi:hypothetical protein
VEFVTFCLGEGGVSQFKDLLYCRPPACFAALDLLSLDGHDLRGFRRSNENARGGRLVQSGPDLLELSHFDGFGRALFRQICRLDLEGIVAKYKDAPYGPKNSWVKIKNPSYSQIIARATSFSRSGARNAGPRYSDRGLPEGFSLTVALRLNPLICGDSDSRAKVRGIPMLSWLSGMPLCSVAVRGRDRNSHEHMLLKGAACTTL